MSTTKLSLSVADAGFEGNFDHAQNHPAASCFAVLPRISAIAARVLSPCRHRRAFVFAALRVCAWVILLPTTEITTWHIYGYVEPTYAKIRMGGAVTACLHTGLWDEGGMGSKASEGKSHGSRGPGKRERDRTHQQPPSLSTMPGAQGAHMTRWPQGLRTGVRGARKLRCAQITFGRACRGGRLT